ncbi:MAG: tripartite tricarboxylate transporter TctB family protein [Alsobacter sp.]
MNNRPDLDAATKDVAAGGILLVLAALYYWQTRQILDSSLADAVGPKGLPLMLGAGLAIVAALITLRGAMAFRRAKRAAATHHSADGRESEVASIPRALGFIAIGIGYILIGPVVGYPVAIGLLIAAVALYEGGKPSLGLLGVAAGAGVGLWIIFVYLLGTEQPQSWFF